MIGTRYYYIGLRGVGGTLRGRALWAHDLKPDRAIAATSRTLPGASFVANGAALDDRTRRSEMAQRLCGRATFEGEFSNVTRSYGGKGVVRYV